MTSIAKLKASAFSHPRRTRERTQLNGFVNGHNLPINTDAHEPLSADFLPLTVDYRENNYAAGRIPGRLGYSVRTVMV